MKSHCRHYCTTELWNVRCSEAFFAVRLTARFKKISNIRLVRHLQVVDSINFSSVVSVARAWCGMERKFRYGIWKMPEWNGMEEFKNGIEDNLPYLHTNSVLDFPHGICRKIYTDSDN